MPCNIRYKYLHISTQLLFVCAETFPKPALRWVSVASPLMNNRGRNNLEVVLGRQIKGDARGINITPWCWAAILVSENLPLHSSM